MSKVMTPTPAEPQGGLETVVSAAATSSLHRGWLEAVLPAVFALLVAMVIGDLLILAFGQNPGEVYRLMIHGSWANAWGFGQVMFKATTFIFTGLAVAIGLRAGVFNIGAESQLAAGAFAAAVAGLIVPEGTAWPVMLIVCGLAAFVGGGIVGSVPGALKARFGAHEVIVTIMLNFVVLAALNWILAAKLRVPETLRTPSIKGETLPRVSDVTPAFHGSAANLMMLVAFVAAAACWHFLFRTRAGYELRAVGLQPAAAEAGGISTGRTWLTALIVSGALAGLGGLNFVLGYKGYYEEGLAGGAGFLGIAVALVGRNHPAGVVAAAFLFATLSQGGLAINAIVPKDVVEVLQGVVIIAMAVAVPLVSGMLRSNPRVRA